MCLRFPKPISLLRDRRARKADDDRRVREWAAAVKRRAGYQCEICGRRHGLEAHHIISRRYKATRYDVANGACLCAKPCHQNLTGHVLAITGRDATGRLQWERRA